MKADVNSAILITILIGVLMLWGAILCSTVIADYFKHKNKSG